MMRIRDYIRRWSFRFLWNPDAYIEELPDDFNYHAWRSDRYRWEPDPLDGFVDHVQFLDDTIESETGDCIDFAFVTVCWLISRDESCYLGLSFNNLKGFPVIGRIPWLRKLQIPQHAIVSDGERLYEGTGRVEPNGQMYSYIGEYLEESGYDNILLWQVD